VPQATSAVPPHMNNENREEPSRYVSLICIIMDVVHKNAFLLFNLFIGEGKLRIETSGGK
jgi:hypothetical protein